jgi:hypothetical protein
LVVFRPIRHAVIIRRFGYTSRPTASTTRIRHMKSTVNYLAPDESLVKLGEAPRAGFDGCGWVPLRQVYTARSVPIPPSTG